MCPHPAAAELPTMTLRVMHPARIGVLATALLALLGAVLLVLAGTGSSTQPAPLTQLQRAAVFPTTNVGPGPVTAAIPAGEFAVHLRIEPNHAFAHNSVTVWIARHGQPLSGADVTVSYAMPAMNMGNVLTSTLSERTLGTYSIREPVLGMPGRWVMSFRVDPPAGRPFTVAVADMRQ